MARKHWKFVVRDRYGYTIQNARVYAYQPGTSNAFVGSAYDAASGGSTVTNPMTTNAQGEAEAWFDTAQNIDVFVDDNADTAYRATDGPGAVHSFTAFTEVSEVGEDPTDAINHGAASHTNLTRKIWLPVHDGAVLDGGTLTTSGTAPNAIRTVSLADAATSGVAWAFTFDDWAADALSVQVYFAGSTTNANSVRWQLVTHKIANGGDITATGTTVAYTSIPVATANLLIKDTLTSTTVTPANGDVMRISLRRLGTDGADAYTGAALVLGIMLSYTATE